MAARFQVTFDCADPARLAEFWAAALSYQLQPPPPGFDTWPDFLVAQGLPADANLASAVVDPEGAGSRLFFQRVPEPKTVKNRVHLDLGAGGGPGTPMDQQRERVAAAVQRLEELGATKLYEREEMGIFFATMADPEDNEFCT